MNPRGEEREMSIVLCDNFLLSFVVSQADGCLFCFSSGEKEEDGFAFGQRTRYSTCRGRW